MPINRYLLAKEKAFTNWLYRIFRKSEKRLQEFLIKQDELLQTKWFEDELWEIIEEMVTASALYIGLKSKAVMKKGAWVNKKLNPKFAIDFNSPNTEASKYIEGVIQVHSSIYVEGSIWKTTHTRILWLIGKWIDEWLSYTEVAKDITKIDPITFSKNRAKLIAVGEMGNAYEVWKFMPMADLERQWEIVLKKWQTVWDDRVRATHIQNQNDWYIPIKIPFSWTGTERAPSWYNCRCALVYKVI